MLAVPERRALSRVVLALRASPIVRAHDRPLFNKTRVLLTMPSRSVVRPSELRHRQRTSLMQHRQSIRRNGPSQLQFLDLNRPRLIIELILRLQFLQKRKPERQRLPFSWEVNFSQREYYEIPPYIPSPSYCLVLLTRRLYAFRIARGQHDPRSAFNRRLVLLTPNRAGLKRASFLPFLRSYFNIRDKALLVVRVERVPSNPCNLRYFTRF